MKTTVDTDLIIEASEEAKICLNCGKPKCTPANCERLKTKTKELKAKRRRNNGKFSVQHM